MDRSRTSRLYFILQAFALAAVVAGFPLVAAFSQLIDLPSQPFSIAMRGITAMFCAVLMMLSLSGNRNAIWWWFVLACAGFWFLYLIRMTNDTLLKSYSLFYEPSSYWLWAVGGSIIPLFGLARAQFQMPDANRYFNWCFAFAFAAAVFAVPNLSTTVSNEFETYEGGRAALTALNPISLGHLGVQLILFAMWALFLRRGEMKNGVKLMFLVASVLGLYLALVANSRGPLVSLVAAALFAIMASNMRSKYWVLGLMLVAAAAFAPLLTFVDHVAGTNVYDRLLGTSQFEEVNTLGRIELYTSAWNQFLKFPLTGYGLEDPVFGGYPHNIVIESFMSTGLVGGLLMLTILILTLIMCYRMLRTVPSFGWLALLVVQQVVAMQFSGTIGQGTVLWGVVGALVSAFSLATFASARRPAVRQNPAAHDRRPVGARRLPSS